MGFKRFEILSHTADIKVKFYGKNFEEIIDSVFIFYYHNTEINISNFEITEELIIDIEDEGLEFLVVRLINELIYLKETGKFVKNYEILKLNNNLLKIKLNLIKKKFSFIEELKSATYHDLKLEKENGFISIIVTIDV